MCDSNNTRWNNRFKNRQQGFAHSLHNVDYRSTFKRSHELSCGYNHSIPHGFHGFNVSVYTL